MSRGTRLLAIAVVAGALAGCIGPGLIYTDITEPLDLGLDATPVAKRHGDSDWKTFQYVVQVDWDSAAIADAARAGGLTELYCADVQHIYVLFGIWQQHRAIVYGK